jgi:hypothetical protein
MSPSAVLEEVPAAVGTVPPAPAPATGFRLRPIMRQGTASCIPETWCRFASVEEARRAVKPMYHDDRVLRVFLVTDAVPPQFVEWIER